MKRLLLILGGAVGVVIALVVAAPFLIPAATVKDQLAAYVEQATGRKLVVGGDSRVQLFPSAGVTFERVQLSGPDGKAKRPFLRADAITAELDLWSLLGGAATFDSLALENAVIDLRVNADGSVNWEFSNAPNGGAWQGAPVRPVYAGVAAASPMRVGIRRVSLRNSTIRYHAPDSRAPIEITDTNLVLRMPSPDTAATLTGAFAMRGRRIAVEAGLETLAQLNQGARAQLVAELSSTFGELRFDGHATPDRALIGALTLKADRAAELFAIAGAKTAPAIKSASLNATLDARQDAARLSDLRAEIDDMTATGEVAVAMTGARPALNGRLAFDTLDLHALRMQPVPEDAADARNSGLWPAHAAKPDDITLNVDWLSALDADVMLTAQSLKRQALKASDAEAKARLHNAKLLVDLTKLSLYGGRATGAVEVTAHKGVPVINMRADVQQVDALPLFTDASSFDWLSGKLTGAINLASGGKTLNGLRSRLRGEAKMLMRAGALRGLDLPGILARVQAGELSEFSRREGAETRFARLEASWKVKKGVARTKDLELDGPFVSATGRGDVDIRRERLDMKLNPRISTRNAKGKGADPIALPMRIEGDWDTPNIYPDVEEVLKNPEQSVGAAKNLGKAVEKLTDGKVSEDDFKNALDGLLGTGD